MHRPIYLDYNATTPIDPVVLDTMMLFLKDAYGNASSATHAYGWEASQAVENARKSVAKLIGSKPQEIYWTSGATESNNMALLCYMRQFLRDERVKTRPHMVTSLVEHKAVLDVAHALESEGAEVTYLKPDRYGQISAQSVEESIRPNTRLVSIIFGQNEIGTINPIGEIGRVCKKNRVVFHTDAAQSVGKTSIDVEKMNIDFLSGSGHKIYAPKGIGFLYVRKGIQLQPLQFGGSQECGLRPGTINVAGAVALGKACEVAEKAIDSEIRELTQLRDDFIQSVLSEVPTVQLNGHPRERLYSNVSFSFKNLSSDVFTLGLSGLAISSGSACAAGAPSHVLEAIGLPKELARATIRIGIGRFTSKSDLEFAKNKIIQLVKKNLELSEE